jgi:hypothetical protein
MYLAYQDGAVDIVQFGRCDAVRRDHLTRYDGHDAWRAFMDRYTEQEPAHANPDAVAPADCAPCLMPAQPGAFARQR